MHVLLAEDSAPIAQAVSFCLGQAGHTVDIAADGEAAIERLAKGDVDLLILDFGLPKADGATVLHAVAGFTGHSRVKTSTLVDAGGKLPLVLTFIDKEEHVDRVLPQIKQMAGHRLIVREKVTIEGEAD